MQALIICFHVLLLHETVYKHRPVEFSYQYFEGGMEMTIISISLTRVLRLEGAFQVAQ